MPVTSNPNSPTPLMMGKKLSNPKVWDGWESLQVDADGMLFPIAKAFQSWQSEVAAMCRWSHPTQYHARTLGSILYKSCSRALTLVYAPYSVRQADAMMEGLFAYKVQRSPSGSLGRTKEVERMSKGLQCPWVHNWVFCSSGSLLHLLKAGLVSITEFAAGSSGFSIGFPK